MLQPFWRNRKLILEKGKGLRVYKSQIPLLTESKIKRTHRVSLYVLTLLLEFIPLVLSCQRMRENFVTLMNPLRLATWRRVWTSAQLWWENINFGRYLPFKANVQWMFNRLIEQFLYYFFCRICIIVSLLIQYCAQYFLWTHFGSQTKCYFYQNVLFL